MKKSFRIFAENIIIPVILMLLPLRHVTEGIDISDTGYSLACFHWFGKLPGAVWVYVTYLANVVGHFFTTLPMGNTWLGMNIYCSLVVSLLVGISYSFLKDKIRLSLLVIGEIIAIALCWCPHIILYNYMTYLALLLGTVALYEGLVREKKWLLVMAGVILGLGVGVRFSNFTHMALICGLWYYGFLKKHPFKKVLADTFLCILGYVIGLFLFAGCVYCGYRFENYGEMLSTLFTMNSTGAGGYGLADMLLDAWLDYFEGLKWGILFIAYALFGLLFWKVFLPKLTGQREDCGKPTSAWGKTATILYAGGFIVLVRFCYGRGMFGLNYNEFFAYFKWAGFFAVVAIVGCVITFLKKSTPEDEKLLAVFMLITIFILPIGSNNHAHPLYNDLFLIAPVCLMQWKKLMPRSLPIRMVALGCFLVFFVQVVLFGSIYVFRDGAPGQKRDTKVESSAILSGMHTLTEHGKNLEEVCAYANAQGWDGHEVILYGSIPGLSYILNMPSALSTTYANLDSYNMDLWARDFKRVEEKMVSAPNDDASYPVIMIGNGFEPTDDKKELLLAFAAQYNYTKTFENAEITAYERITK